MSGTVETNVFSLNKLYQLVVDGQVRYDAPDGDIWVWGSNFCGSFGINSTNGCLSPIAIPGLWSQAVAGTYVSLARKTDNTLWTWGQNNFGQLGTNNTIERSSPIQVPGTSWVDISTGGRNLTDSCTMSLARKSDGTLWAWGNNLRGQLGLNDRVSRSSPVQIPGTSWVEAFAGAGIAGARKSDNTLWVWGFNCLGQLGLNDIISRSSPVQIPGTNWTQISTRSIYNMAARKSDGTLWVWGDSSNRALPFSDSISRSSPTQVPGTSWVDVSFAGQPTRSVGLALKSDGTLWTWGANDCGQLGTNDGISRSSPIQIPGTSWVTGVATQMYRGASAAARKSDGTLWMWGDGEKMGQGDIISRSSPVQVPGNGWKSVSIGERHVLAIGR